MKKGFLYEDVHYSNPRLETPSITVREQFGKSAYCDFLPIKRITIKPL